MALFVFCLARTGWAGYEVTSYTSTANAVTITGQSGVAWYKNYSGQPPGPHGGGSLSSDPPPNPHAATNAGVGSVACAGTITAHITYTGDADAKPKCIILKETATASWSGSSGGCSDGLGGTATTHSSGGSCQTIYYSVMNDPEDSFTTDCSPSANASLPAPTTFPDEGTALVAASANVSYKVEVFPAEINLSVGVGPPHNKQFLIGQQVTATLSAGELTHDEFDPFSWNVSGGEPFKNWWADSEESHYYPLESEHDSSLVFHFKKPYDNDEVTCSAHLDVPPGTLPADGLDVTVRRKCKSVKPFNSLSVYIGTTQGLTAPNPNEMALWGATHTDENNQYYLWGTLWSGKVTTPVQFGEGGGWNYTQLVTAYRVAGTSETTHYFPPNGRQMLDTSFGYAPVDPQQYPADGSENVEGDKPSTSLAAPRIYAEVLDRFITYTLYMPPGEGSAYVPLKDFEWFWKGKSSPDGSGIWQVYATDSGWSFLEDFPSFPVWDDNVGDYLAAWIAATS